MRTWLPSTTPLPHFPPVFPSSDGTQAGTPHRWAWADSQSLNLCLVPAVTKYRAVTSPGSQLPPLAPLLQAVTACSRCISAHLAPQGLVMLACR